MIYLILFLLLLGIVALFANQLRAFRDDPSAASPSLQAASGECAACADEKEACATDRLLAGMCQPIVYFEDEELDAFQGRSSDGYTPEEVEAFREVLFSMQATEVSGWLHSLGQRDVALPDELKDEAFLLAGKL